MITKPILATTQWLRVTNWDPHLGSYPTNNNSTGEYWHKEIQLSTPSELHQISTAEIAAQILIIILVLVH